MSKHKDVDVMVLDQTEEIEKFEGGVDWWLLKQEEITIKSDYSRVEGVNQRWYENGNNVKLSFGAKRTYSLEPGLYIPDCEWVINMRVAEVAAHIDYNNVELDFGSDVFDKYRKQIEKRVKTRLPPFIKEAFKGYILSLDYEENYSKTYAVCLEEFDLQTIIAINGLEEMVEEDLTDN